MVTPFTGWFDKLVVPILIIYKNYMAGSVVPKRVQWTIIHEFFHIWGEREQTVLYSGLSPDD